MGCSQFLLTKTTQKYFLQYQCIFGKFTFFIYLQTILVWKSVHKILDHKSVFVPQIKRFLAMIIWSNSTANSQRLDSQTKETVVCEKRPSLRIDEEMQNRSWLMCWGPSVGGDMDSDSGTVATRRDALRSAQRAFLWQMQEIWMQVTQPRLRFGDKANSWCKLAPCFGKTGKNIWTKGQSLLVILLN